MPDAAARADLANYGEDDVLCGYSNWRNTFNIYTHPLGSRLRQSLRR